MKKKLVVFTGAGISAESGIQTFRDSGGLWEKYDVNEVATIQAWRKNPALVLEFYNARRNQLLECEPNQGHLTLVELEDYFDVTIVTQNVDDLHERAGSSNILHLHGELMKCRSSKDESFTYDYTSDLKMGDRCELGSQMRPYIVWFGEDVSMMPKAEKIFREADYCAVIGTSLNVYPAAGLVMDFRGEKMFLVDPNVNSVLGADMITIAASATKGVPKLKELLLKEIE